MIKASVFFSALLTVSGLAFFSVQRTILRLDPREGSTSQREEIKNKQTVVSSIAQLVDSPKPRRLNSSCDGRWIFVYDLPTKFNYKISKFCKRMHKFIPTCPDTRNFGFGVPAVKPEMRGKVEICPEASWYRTDQFSLEVIFHEKMKAYPCLTLRESEADLFFVPFYAGLSICDSLYKSDVLARDVPGGELIAWLNKRASWHRNQGRDHVMVLGRVVWDFLRTVVSNDWGNTFLRMSYMQNVTAVSIEGSPHPVHGVVHSVPYPTSFHPKSVQEIQEWQERLRGASRKHLVAFMGMFHGKGATLRQAVVSMCTRHSNECKMMTCVGSGCLMPERTVRFYKSARFCLMPPGDTPTRKAFFDCILAGAIPVVFDGRTSHKQYKWFLPSNPESFSVFIPETEFWQNQNSSFVMSILRSMKPERVAKMRENVINLIPRLVYNHPEGNFSSHHLDAFGVAISRILENRQMRET